MSDHTAFPAVRQSFPAYRLQLTTDIRNCLASIDPAFAHWTNTQIALLAHVVIYRAAADGEITPAAVSKAFADYAEGTL
jgi:hypothetical protein